MRRALRSLVGVLLLAMGAGACSPDSAADADPPVSSVLDPSALFERVAFGELVRDGGLSRGVAWGDLDGDEDADLVVANTLNWPQFLYRNDGDGTFTERHGVGPTLAAGWTEGVSWVDVEGDGDLDLFLTQDRDATDVLYLNDGEGELRPVKAGSLTSDIGSSRQACWADYDRDGDVDVYVARGGGDDDALYENLGEMAFRRVPRGPWVGLGNEARSCGAADLDGDGLAEIYVGNFVSQRPDGRYTAEDNLLFRNLGELRFRRVTEGPAVTDSALTYGVSWSDWDEDGDLDLFVTNIGVRDSNMLLENDGSGGLRLRDELLPVSESRGPSKGHTWGDFDLDGHIDLFVANGTEGVDDVEDYDVRNFLYLGRPEGSFERIVRGPLVEDRDVSAGAAWSDVEGDGDLDLFVANWGGSDEDNALYRNSAAETSGRGWIVFVPEEFSTQTELGTRVRVLAAVYGREETSHWQHRTLSSSTGYASQNERVLHFGLGSADVVDSVEVRWPDGTVEAHGRLEGRRRWRLPRGRDALRAGDGDSYRLSASKSGEQSE